MEFTIKLAGIPVRVAALYESTRDHCGAYLTEEEPLFTVVSDGEKIAAERRMSEETEGEGLSRYYSDAYLETLAVYRQIAEKMTEFDTILFHGSVIAVDGEAYIFTAPSGTGKSTHTRLWREVLPKYGHEVFMVNDDKPLLRFTDEGICACGTPWNGKHRLGTNCMVPVKGVCSLEQAPENEIHRMDLSKIWPVLMRQSYRPEEPAHVAATLKLLDRLAQEVPMYELRCNMDPEAALVSFEAMSR